MGQWSPSCLAHANVFFLSCAQLDRLVKVWWQQDADKKSSTGAQRWTFVYLAHPQAVTGLQWREQSVMSSRRFSNAKVLLTSCRDGVTRIWTGIAGYSNDLLHFHLAASLPPIDPPPANDTRAETASLGSTHTLSSVAHAYEGHYINSVPVVFVPGREMCMSVTLKESMQEKGICLDAGWQRARLTNSMPPQSWS